jgi:hypothetical protein
VVFRKLVIVAGSFLLSSGLACAADDVSGTVQLIDRSSRHVFLVDGKNYIIARGINLAKFKVGEHVSLRLEDVNGKEVVTKMIKGEAFPLLLPGQNRNSRTR